MSGSSAERQSESAAANSPAFATTHWSVVLAAGDSALPQAAQALEKLCRTYWYPLYSYVRRLGHSSEDARDLTQEFFARVLEKRYLRAADPDKGRFRTFLLVAFNRFLANEWDRSQRQKRGGGCPIVSLDAEDAEGRYLAEPADDVTPQKVFERRWAMALLHEVLDRLELEFASGGKAGLFASLKPWLTDEEGASYGETAARLEMTEGALRVAVHRLRQRYRELLRSEIGHTLARPEEIDEEIRHLFTALST